MRSRVEQGEELMLTIEVSSSSIRALSFGGSAHTSIASPWWLSIGPARGAVSEADVYEVTKPI